MINLMNYDSTRHTYMHINAYIIEYTSWCNKLEHVNETNKL